MSDKGFWIDDPETLAIVDRSAVKPGLSPEDAVCEAVLSQAPQNLPNWKARRGTKRSQIGLSAIRLPTGLAPELTDLA